MSGDEWTPIRGLARGSAIQLAKGLACFLIWGAILLAVAPVLNMAAPYLGRRMGWLLVALPMMVPGAIFGYLMGSKTTDQFGFCGPIVASICSGILLAAIVGGTWIVHSRQTATNYLFHLAAIAAGMTAVWIIARKTWWDAD